MLAILKDLRAVSQDGATCAMVACVQAICEAREGRNAAGMLAETLRAEVLKQRLSGSELNAFIEGYLDTVQRFVEAHGLGKPTISNELR